MTKNYHKIKGIIFDLDGVLCDSEEFIASAAVEMFRQRYNTSVDSKHFKQFIGAGESKFLSGVGEIYGLQVKLPDDKNHTYDIYLKMIENQLSPLEGVGAFIKFARSKGLKLAIASAADRIKVEGNLKQIGFPAETFDAIVSGCDVANNKPAPDIFLKAAEKLSLNASDCMVVEDALNGVIAAKSAGAFSLGISTSFTGQELLQIGADWTAPNLGLIPTDMLNKIF